MLLMYPKLIKLQEGDMYYFNSHIIFNDFRRLVASLTLEADILDDQNHMMYQILSMQKAD